MSKPVILHIGYPKAASTFLQEYLRSHPDVVLQIAKLTPIIGNAHQSAPFSLPSDGREISAYVFSNEKIAESVIITGDRAIWRKNRFIPGAWSVVEPHIQVSALETAKRFKAWLKPDKVLIVVRDQLEWIHSSYKYTLPSLPLNRRTFADYCETPHGKIYLTAGYMDRVIGAYQQIFGDQNVLVMRSEDFAKDPVNSAATLCGLLGIRQHPFPSERSNEGAKNSIALMRMRFPIVDRFPDVIRRLGKLALQPFLAEKSSILLPHEIEQLRARYSDSNNKMSAFIRSFGR